MIQINEEFRRIVIKTGIDRLLDLIIENKGINVAEASRILQIPSKSIESWSQILSKEKLITVKYETDGAIILNLAKKNMARQKGMISKLSNGIATDINSIDNELTNYERTIDLNKENINSFEKILNKDISKIENIEKDIIEFSKKKKELEKSILKIKKEESILRKEEDELDKKEKEISSKEKLVQDTSQTVISTITDKLKILDESHNKIVSLENDKNRLKDDLEFIKKISKVIENEKDMEKLHEHIITVEDRHKKLKDNSLLLKIKLERFQEIIKKIFQI